MSRRGARRLRSITDPEAVPGGRRADEAGSWLVGNAGPSPTRPGADEGEAPSREDPARARAKESAGEGGLGAGAASAAPSGKVKRPAARADDLEDILC